MLSERIRSGGRRVAGVAATVILGGFLVGSDTFPERPPRPVARHFHGKGCLPLSGDLAVFGMAYREGFLEGLRSAPDSLFDWTWEWTDNEGDPSRVREIVASSDSSRLVLVGVSSAASGLASCQSACMVLGDGGEHPDDPLRWDLWTPSSRERDRLLSRLKASEPPWTVVVEASGAWVEPIFPALSDSLPGLLVLMHDPDNSRWDDAIQQILQLRPRTILFWDSPSDASALLGRRLAWPIFRSARLWVPEGATVPEGIRADTLRPLWQATAGDSSGTLSWRRWGQRCGRALAQASRFRIVDTLGGWNEAFRKVPADGELDAGVSGWYPRGP